jgi:hypothetical protein
MKVLLAQDYWRKILALPSTVGTGAIVLWLRRSTWPLRIDQSGLVLRNHQRVAWGSVRKIGVSRRYLDGRLSHIRIHHSRGISHVPLDAIEDGENVARQILSIFAGVRKERRREYRPELKPPSTPSVSAHVRNRALERSPMRFGRSENRHFV